MVVKPKKIELSQKSLFVIALIIFSIFGFATKLIMSINLNLGMDSVGEGLQAMEIWKHHNYLLSGYYLPSQDTFIFTELLPFQLIPQVLTNFNPLTLKIMSFIIFVLAIAVLAYVVFLVSGEIVNALLFTALASNLPPQGYDGYFNIPTTHIATIVFLGVIFALLLYLGKNNEIYLDKAKKLKKKHVPQMKVQWHYVAGISILAALAVLSDTIILIWLIVPYVLAYLLFVKEKNKTTDLAIVCMVVVSALVYIIKNYFVPQWILQSYISLDQSKIISVNLPLSFKSLAIFLNSGLYGALNSFQGFGYLEAVSLIVFAVLAIYAIRNAVVDGRNKFFYGILLFSGVIMFASFLVMSLVKDMYEARYFTFTGLTVFMLIAVSYRKNDKIFGAIALVLLLISAVFSLSYVSTMLGHQSNASEYGLISFLEEHNLTYGYSSTYYAGTITYLSGEDVTVRPVVFYSSDLKPNGWLACERWFQSPQPDNAFILVDKSALNENALQVLNSTAKALNASEPLRYGTYEIYPTNKRAFMTLQA